MASMTRRTFMMGSAGLAAASSVYAASPNETLNIAAIGIGGQGKHDLKELAARGVNVTALCDVDWKLAGKAFETYPDAKRYKDFRVMFDEQSDFDGVVVATPDHTHAVASLWAMGHGKHVYCEKPLTHTVREARTLAEKYSETGLATQMGNTGQASDGARTLREYLIAGAVGPVRAVHVWTDRPIWPQAVARPQETKDVPESLDWDLWLGTAPERPFHPIYHPFRWRGWYDFGTGALGDIGCHRFHPLFYALDLKHPTSVHASSTELFDETYPAGSIVHYEFPARGEWPACSLTWYDGGLKPTRPRELEAGRALKDNGNIIYGDDGVMLDGRLLPESRMEDFPVPDETLSRSPGHYEEWIEACKGGPTPGANFEMAGMVTEVVLLGNIALRTQERLEWDAPNLRITNSDDANALLHRDYRPGWEI